MEAPSHDEGDTWLQSHSPDRSGIGPFELDFQVGGRSEIDHRSRGSGDERAIVHAAAPGQGGPVGHERHESPLVKLVAKRVLIFHDPDLPPELLPGKLGVEEGTVDDAGEFR